MRQNSTSSPLQLKTLPASLSVSTCLYFYIIYSISYYLDILYLILYIQPCLDICVINRLLIVVACVSPVSFCLYVWLPIIHLSSPVSVHLSMLHTASKHIMYLKCKVSHEPPMMSSSLTYGANT